MATSDSFQEKDRIAWYALQDWLSRDEQGQALLARLRAGQQVEENDLTQWLRAHLAQAPPQVETYIFGGQIQKLINIAQAGVVLIQQSSSPPPSNDKLHSVKDLRQELFTASQGLLSWPRTLGSNQQIERPELQHLLNRIQQHESSTTLVLGGPGTGKSALLATLGHYFVNQGVALLAIKADKLGHGVNTFEDLRVWLHLSLDPRDAIGALAKNERVVLLIDQLDAVSELLDQRSERLNVLLSLIQFLSETHNVHIVATSREFEFRHDVRLSCINAERMDLELPVWEQIAPLLTQPSHNPDSMGEPLRELLRTPLHLKLFLDVAAPGEVFNSLQALLSQLWEQRVVNPQEPPNCFKLLEQIASRITQEEEFWIPAAIADSYPAALQALEQAEILTRSSDGQTIGFRHQTYYDYTLARAFARGSIPLADYVLQRQDGLFVRPVLLSGLNYLRGTSRPQYHLQLQTLLQGGPRLHIRTLLLEFVGGQKDPDDTEAHLLLPLLNSGTEGPRVLAAVAGSPGWFTRLRHHPHLRQWLHKSVEKAVYCVPLLSAASRFASEDVLKLIEDCWLSQSIYDPLSLEVLLNVEQWTQQAVTLASQLVRRYPASWSHTSALAERIAENFPDLAPQLLRADLERRLEQALIEVDKPKPELPLDADEVQQQIHAFTNRPLKPLEYLIENEQDFDNIETFAEAAPKAFLNYIWSWLVDVVSQIAYEENRLLVSYRDAPATNFKFVAEFQPPPVVRGLLTAVSELAEQDIQAFLNFLDENIGSDLKIVHRFLARGLERIVNREPQRVLEYLLGDSRRLNLGDFENQQRETKQLIGLIYPHLSYKDRTRLEDAVINFKRYKQIPSELSAQERREFLKSERRQRLRLLRALPVGCLSYRTKRLRDEEERALPETDDFESRSWTGFVGPRLTVDEMVRASDKELLRLFDQLPDRTAWDSPKREWFDDHSRAGGAVQQAGEFCKLVERKPQRVAHLIQYLKPRKHETYAGAALEGLAGTNLPTADLIGLIENLEQRGFASENFRDRAASALEKCAHRAQGLPDAILCRLEIWLTEHPEPVWSIEQDKTTAPKKSVGWSPKKTCKLVLNWIKAFFRRIRRKLSNKRLWQDRTAYPTLGRAGTDKTQSITEPQKAPILLKWGTNHIVPHGRGYILRAIAAGYLEQQPPDLDNWARIIKCQLNRERHPAIWVETLIKMPVLFNGDPIQATQLYDAVVQNCPEVLHNELALYFIALIIRWLQPKEKVQEWLEKLLVDGSAFCRQAYGELLFIYYCRYQDTWSTKCIHRHFTKKIDEDILRGLAYAASHVWGQNICRPMATDILCALASHPAKSIQCAVADVFRLNRDNFELNAEMRRVIQAVRGNGPVLLEASSNLIEMLEPLTGMEPAIMSQVCQELLRVGSSEINNLSTSLPLLAGTLTNIALTLHRQSTYREIGLSIFEELLSLNLREARSALEVLDRKPTQIISPMPRRRRRRRRTS